MALNPHLFDVEYHDGTLILTPLYNLGEFAMMDLHDDADRILALCEHRFFHHVLIDFSKTDYLESTALGFLALLYRKLSAHQGTLACCCASDYERQLLAMTKLDHLFSLYDSRTEALEVWEIPQ